MIGPVLFGLGIGGAIIAVCWAISQAAAQMAEADRYDADGDWPYVPQVFPPRHDEGK